jgi:hypothetical protein
VAAAEEPRRVVEPPAPPTPTGKRGAESRARAREPDTLRAPSSVPPGEAGEIYARAIQFSKQSAAGRDWDAQLRHAEEALAVRPDDDEAHFLAGHAGCMKKDEALAKRHYARLRLPQYRAALDDVCTRFAAIYLTPDSKDSPADRQRRVQEMYPDAVETMLKDPAKALAMAEEMIRLQPQFEGGYIVGAGSACRLGKLDVVRKYLPHLREAMYDVVAGNCRAANQPFPDPRADAGP